MTLTTRKALLAIALLVTIATGNDILRTSGFTDCGSDTSIRVERLDISYDKSDKVVTFDVAGRSMKQQNVSASLNVTAYGKNIYTRAFSPCDQGTFVEQLCPLPVGNFSARGTQKIPDEFADLVPAIAFKIPDIAAQATLELNSVGNGRKVACINSEVSNGKSANVPAVSYVAAGVAGVALLVTGASAAGAALSGAGVAAGSGHAGGLGTISPSFTEVFGWFQGMAMNGMLSVSYPPIYRSFAKNFAFSTGVIPWTQLLSSIDDFRGKTGGNLTEDNVDYVRKATMIYPDGSTGQADTGVLNLKRAIGPMTDIIAREFQSSINDTTSNRNGGHNEANLQQTVHGIQAYAQRLAVPKSDIFMTALLVVAIVIASIVLGILLVKVILEVWALWGNFPDKLKGFRRHYWGSIARTITSLILLLYGIWVLYCVFQFTNGDSWAAKTLAGVTLALFTAVLGYFTWKIWRTVQRLKAEEGDASGLYDRKEVWVKYSIFYDCYRRSYWWLFVPAIVYMFAKGATIAAGDGHGREQTIAQIVIESGMLVLLLWSRPYERRSGNIINIIIQVVRVLSVVCILVFVEEFGIAQTTRTVAGVVLIVVQSVLTGVLAILIIWNGINACCKANPHRQRRKELEKYRDLDTLTPLDARNSLLLERPGTNVEKSIFTTSSIDMGEKTAGRSNSLSKYHPDIVDVPVPSHSFTPFGTSAFRPSTLADDQTRHDIHGTSGMELASQQPTLPQLDATYGNYGVPQTQYRGVQQESWNYH